MHSTECNDNALVKMHYNAGKNIECNMCRIRRIMHNASIVRTRSKCKIARMFKNVIENSRMIYNALRIIGAKITRLWGKNHTPPTVGWLLACYIVRVQTVSGQCTYSAESSELFMSINCKVLVVEAVYST